MVQLMVQLLVQLNYIIISYLYIGPRCLSKFITLAPTLALCQRDSKLVEFAICTNEVTGETVESEFISSMIKKLTTVLVLKAYRTPSRTVGQSVPVSPTMSPAAH
jgi:hypothetical protein